MHILLASASEIRARLLQAAGLSVVVRPAAIDEDAIRLFLQAQSASPRAIALALATQKAQAISANSPAELVFGADQILECAGEIFAKPESLTSAQAQLLALSGKTHSLLSALVICQNGQAIWHHVAEVRLTMHSLSPAFIAEYTARNWHSIRHSVGCYKLEEEGVRLFSAVEGDYFAVLGIPLIQVLNWLRDRGDLTT